MIKLPDNSEIQMAWDFASYRRDDKQLVLTVIPMVEGPDLILVPERTKITDPVVLETLDEFLVLLNAIPWKREIGFLTMDITPNILNRDQDPVAPGSFSDTVGAREINADALFDPESPLTNDQVKEIYITLETRYAQGLSGEVTLVENGWAPGSVFEQVILPTLQQNPNIQLKFV